MASGKIGDQPSLGGHVGPRAGDDHEVAAGRGRSLDRACQLGEERVLEVGDHQSEQVGRPGVEGTGAGVWSVVQRGDGGAHPSRGLGRDRAWTAVDHVADHGRADPGATGHVVPSRRASSHLSVPSRCRRSGSGNLQP